MPGIGIGFVGGGGGLRLLRAGAISASGSPGLTTLALIATDANGGVPVKTYQWQRSTVSGSGYANVSGATNLTLNDTGLTPNTDYYYRVQYTSGTQIVYSAEYHAQTVWAPSALVSLAPSLQVALSRSQGKLWQERDGSRVTPAVADGDPVGEAISPWDSSSYIAASDSTRPLLKSEGSGKWSLLFDGVDDVLACTVSITWTALAHAVFGRIEMTGSPDAFDVIAVATQSSGGWTMYSRLSSTAHWGTFGGAEQAASTTLGTGSFLTLGMNGGAFRLADAGDGTYSASGGSSGGTGLTIGRDPSFGGRFFGGRIAALIVCTAALSDPDQTLLEGYLDGL